ncbi:MazG-like family protein [Fredinandcohnia sp. 179-A 10B2 NHS]|uniref:MazG-like family protein n=1 Tax=Fredinandcohnia sp. 179-A 10B2 NHS TaxID=3235176 RepID=UPI0039A1514C
MNHTLEQLKMSVLTDVMNERDRQDKLWGIQRHDYSKWNGILGEEYGEVCQAINGINFPKDAKETDASNLYTELIQVAAVACAIAEQLVEERHYIKMPLKDLWTKCEKKDYSALKEWLRRYEANFPHIGGVNPYDTTRN